MNKSLVALIFILIVEVALSYADEEMQTPPVTPENWPAAGSQQAPVAENSVTSEWKEPEDPATHFSAGIVQFYYRKPLLREARPEE